MSGLLLAVCALCAFEAAPRLPPDPKRWPKPLLPSNGWLAVNPVKAPPCAVCAALTGAVLAVPVAVVADAVSSALAGFAWLLLAFGDPKPVLPIVTRAAAGVAATSPPLDTRGALGLDSTLYVMEQNGLVQISE